MVRKGADIRRLLERRLGLWQQGKFDMLIQEAEHSNQALRWSQLSVVDDETVLRVFTKLMLHGKVKAAIRWATERTRGVVLSPSDLLDDSSTTTVMDILCQKHPPPSSDFVSLLKCDPLPQLEDVQITGSHILCSARRIQGGAGLGGCISCHWRDVLLRYGAHSARLRDAVAALSRRLANTIFPWNDIHALVSNRLIALDKCPGVRPIGIGETLRHIIGKAICSATRGDIESLCGADQLCGGVKSGIEGAIHAMNEMYSQNCTSDDWGILLVDASNAFNSLNRAALLWNARIFWPRCSRFLFNTYSGWAALVVHGSEEFLNSREGVTIHVFICCWYHAFD